MLSNARKIDMIECVEKVLLTPKKVGTCIFKKKKKKNEIFKRKLFSFFLCTHLFHSLSIFVCYSACSFIKLIWIFLWIKKCNT